MRLSSFAYGAAFCVCWATSAVAQTMPAAAAAGGGRDFSGAGSLRVVYDSNFARSNTSVANARSIEPKEVTITPEIRLNVVQPLGRQVVFLAGSAGYDFHHENKDLDRARADIQGGYMTRLGACQASAVASYRAAQSDLATLDTARVKNFGQGISTSIGAQCGRPRGFGGGVLLTRSENKNSAALQKAADSTAETLAVNLGYQNPTVGNFSLTYAYVNSELPNRIIPGRPVGDGFFTQTYGLSAQRQFGSRITARAAAGRTSVKREFDPFGGDLKFSSTSYSVGATYLLGRRITFDLAADRAVAPSVRAGKLYDINTSGRISARYKLGSRYTIAVGHRIDDVNSNVDTALAGTVLTDSRAYSTFGSVTYRQSDLASITLDVRYDEREANLPQFNYNATRVGLSAQVGF